MTLTRRWLTLSLLLWPLLAGCSGTVATTPAQNNNRATVVKDDPLESARLALDKAPDRAACATALQQLNGYLATHPDKRPPALTDGQRDLLRRRFSLNDGELAEVESATFTLLD